MFRTFRRLDDTLTQVYNVGTKWDNHWMNIAKVTAELSKDPSTKVGAVVAANKRLLGAGFNGFPPQVEDRVDWYLDRPVKYSLTIHAEVNAIIEAYKNGHSEQLVGASLYCTLLPCSDCAKLVIAAGIKNVFWIDGASHIEDADSYYNTHSVHEQSFSVFNKGQVNVYLTEAHDSSPTQTEEEGTD